MTQYGFWDEALCGLLKGSRDFADGQRACPRLSRRVGHGEARWYFGILQPL